MPTEVSQRIKGKQAWRDNWHVVGVGIAVSGMIYHLVGALIKPLSAAYGWGRGEISFGLTLIALLILLIWIVCRKIGERFYTPLYNLKDINGVNTSAITNIYKYFREDTIIFDCFRV